MVLHTITPGAEAVWGSSCMVVRASQRGTARHGFVYRGAAHRSGISQKTRRYATGSPMRSILVTIAIANACAVELMARAAMAA